VAGPVAERVSKPSRGGRRGGKTTYLALTDGFNWVAVFGYVVLVGRRVTALDAEIDDLRRRIK
jgi:CcmD family protein